MNNSGTEDAFTAPLHIQLTPEKVHVRMCQRYHAKSEKDQHMTFYIFPQEKLFLHTCQKTPIITIKNAQLPIMHNASSHQLFSTVIIRPQIMQSQWISTSDTAGLCNRPCFNHQIASEQQQGQTCCRKIIAWGKLTVAVTSQFLYLCTTLCHF